MNKEISTRAFRTVTLLGAAALIFSITSNAQAKNPTNSPEYKEAYQCAIENLQEGGEPGSAAGFCVGNSRDPSKTEERAYADAERDFKAGKGSAATTASVCPFAYATYEANGSRSDDFQEGLLTFKTLSEVAPLMGSRDVNFFDSAGQPIPATTVNQWFSPGGKYGHLKVSNAARKACSKQQVGK